MKIEEIKKTVAIKEKMMKELIELKELKKSNFITDEQKLLVDAEILKLKIQLNIKDDFSYSAQEIVSANDVEMLVKDFLPAGAIVVIVAKYGAGKTTFIRHIISELLKNNDNIYAVYIDADNPIQKLKEQNIHNEMDTFGERLKFFGKNITLDDLPTKVEDTIDDLIELQSTHPNRRYVLILDNLKNTARKNRQGLIDGNRVFKYERKFRAVGGSALVLHHINKIGISADTQDIMNFADLSFYLNYNTATNAIVIEPDKQSRYGIKAKAFLVDQETRKILHEIDYETAKRPEIDFKIINHVREVLSCLVEINQEQLLKETQKFRNKILVGEKRFRAILQKYAAVEWNTKRSSKNSIIYSSLDKKLPNCQTILGDNHEK